MSWCGGTAASADGHGSLTRMTPPFPPARRVGETPATEGATVDLAGRAATPARRVANPARHARTPAAARQARTTATARQPRTPAGQPRTPAVTPARQPRTPARRVGEASLRASTYRGDATQHRRRRTAAAAATALTLLATATACTLDKDTAPTTTSVATKATVSVPATPPARTEPGIRLHWGQSAFLPARTFAPTTGLAMYTVTGINPASNVPDSITKDGKAYYVYITVTSLDAKPADAPDLNGLAGSVDGKSAALMVAPPSSNKDCVATTPPEQMKAGDSYATCQLAVVDADQTVTSVVYWADTTTDPALNYEQSPVVWTTPAPPTSSVAPTSAPA